MPFFLLTLVLFSSMEAVSKPLMGIVDPFQLTFHRFLTGLFFLVFVLAMQRKIGDLFSLRRRDLAVLVLLAREDRRYAPAVSSLGNGDVENLPHVSGQFH